jgi:hypothetical protein
MMTESLEEYREQLAGMHTRVLLKELANSRTGGYLHAEQTQALKDELSKREHVPNKVEAKRIRQEKAKANRNK